MGERVDAHLGVRTGRRLHDGVQGLLGFGLQPFRQLVEDIRQPMHPAPLLARLGPHRADGRPEAQRAVADRDEGRPKSPPLEVAQHAAPTVGALPIAILDRDQLFRAVRPHANHHQRAEPILLEAHPEMHAIDPHVHVVRLRESAGAPGV